MLKTLAPIAFGSLLTLACLALVSCGETVERDDSPAPPPPPAFEPEPAAEAAIEIPDLVPAGSVELKKIVDESRGKVVLVDFWANWCAPCKKQFPHTVALHKKHVDDGLVVISLSMDSPDDHDGAKDFLQKQGADFVNLISHDGDAKASYKDLGISALPAYVIFDRAGKRHDLTSGDPNKPLTTEELDLAVAKYLAE